MAYYKICSNCGCNLDPGERCDCEKEKEEKQELSRQYFNQHLRIDGKVGQLAFAFDGPRGGAVIV